MKELDDAVAFHGHLCPMFYLGFRMGKYALRKLDRKREKGVKLHAVVEFTNCFADGIQYVTGATFGKNNLHIRDFGRFASSFYDLSSEKSIRIKMKDGMVKKVLEYGKAGKDVKGLPPSKREAETKRLMRMGKEKVDWLSRLGDSELFDLKSPPPFEQEEGPSLDYIICHECEELALLGYSNEKGGFKVCRSCLKVL